MSRDSLLVGCLVSAVTAWAAAACGSDLPAAAAPSSAPAIDWCAGREVAEHADVAALARGGAGFDPDRVRSLARAGCGRLRGDEKKDVLAAYGALRDWSALPAAELRDYLSALAGDPDAVDRACPALPDRDARRGLAVLLGCRGSDELSFDDDTSSALASAAAVEQCLRPPGAAGPALPAFALCGAEFRLLDRAALERELAGLGAPRLAATRVRLALRAIETVLAGVEARLGPALAERPALRAYFYDIPERALREGERLQRDAAEDLAAVRAYEARFAAAVPPAVTGCFAELRPRLMARLRRAGAATLDRVRAELAGPITSQVARALESCARYDDQGEVAELLAVELASGRSFRGPRSIAYWHLRDALVAAALVGRPFEPEDLDESCEHRRAPMPLGPVRALPLDERRLDVVRAIAPSARGLRVELAAGGGPALVPAQNAAGLAPGRPVTMLCNHATSPRTCSPFAVWKDDRRDVLVSFVGAEL